MLKFSKFTKTFALSVLAPLWLASCSGSEESAGSGEESQLSNQTLVAFVERNIEATDEANVLRYNQAAQQKTQLSLDANSPYAFIPGAQLHVRSSLDVDAKQIEVLESYFGGKGFDAKHVESSADGSTIVFAAHGPLGNASHSTWSIYTYNFDTQKVERVIKDDAVANAGQDTNPAFTDGKIVFSSDRDAGNPDSIVDNIVDDEDGENCYKVPLEERPSLLHTMTLEGQDIRQITYGEYHDVEPAPLSDGGFAFLRISRKYTKVEQCSSLGFQKLTASNTFGSLFSNSVVPGLSAPDQWSNGALCQMAVDSPAGPVVASNTYTILRTDAEGSKVEQLYDSVTTSGSEETFLSISGLKQSENGKLVALIRHQFNALGGSLVELQSPHDTTEDGVFANISPRQIVEGETNLYPNLPSIKGWFGSVVSTGDDSARKVLSWSQCITVDDSNVSAFCQNDTSASEISSKYGLWMLDQGQMLPITRATEGTIISDIALSQANNSGAYPYQPFSAEFVDNLDRDRILCDDPINPVTPATPTPTPVITPTPTPVMPPVVTPVPPVPPVVPPVVTPVPPVVTPVPPVVTPTPPVVTPTPPVVTPTPPVVTPPPTVTPSPEPSEPPEPVNTLPVANAGDDQETTVGGLVVLDGSESWDPDGDTITWVWSIRNATVSDGLTLTMETSATPVLTAVARGTYTLSLVVNDGTVDSAPDTVEVRVLNSRPIASAGDDETTYVGETLSLDGSSSGDADGDQLDFTWSVVGGDEGIVIGDATSSTPEIEVVTEGTYTIQLVVNDGEIDSEPDFLTISTGNRAPVAVAGADAEANVGEPLSLDGSESYDPEGSTLSYSWSVVEASIDGGLVISSADSDTPEVLASEQGVYTLQLVVSDGRLSSAPDLVKVTVGNQAPIANAGLDQPLHIGTPMRLDASASTDADGDPLTYRWSVIEAADPEAIALSSATDVRPEVTIQALGRYRLQLIVNDGFVDSAPDEVVLDVENIRPVANAGPDIAGFPGDPIAIDGSESRDADGDDLSYRWSIVSAPEGSLAELADINEDVATFVPDVLGQYVVQLIVNDGFADSEADQMIIDSTNMAPVADAGSDVSVLPTTTVTLDGRLSSDAEGDTLSFSWSILSQPESDSPAILVDAAGETPSIEVVTAGDYVVQLIVNDGYQDSAPDTVLITAGNAAPIAHAGNDSEAETKELVTLDGSASYDPEGADISYSWTFASVPNGANVAFGDSTSVTPSFTPNQAGTYEIQLVVNDGELSSEPDVVVVEVTDPPVVCEPSDDSTRIFPAVIRDFKDSHPNFESARGLDFGIVEEDLGADGLPVYAHQGGSTLTTTGEDDFNQWYRDVEDVNIRIPKQFEMVKINDSTWEYRNLDFFPINDEGWGNQGRSRNYHFTLESHLTFDYEGGEHFSFSGDDDLWVFINGKLAIDIGGVHIIETRSVSLDDVADYLGIEPGNSYTFDLFFAERHTTLSTFSFQTNINLECK